MTTHKITTALLALLVGAAPLRGFDLAVGPEREFKTIQSAVDSLPSELPESVTIRIDPGVYREMVTLDGIRTRADRTLTLRGADDPSAVVIDAEKTRPHAVLLKKQHHVTLENLTLLRGSGFGNLHLSMSHKNRIRHCILAFSASSLSDGMLLSGSNENLIENNVFAANGRAGAFLLNSSCRNLFRFNLFTNNVTGLGTTGKYPSKPLTVEYNGFFANRRNFDGLEPGNGNLFENPKFTDPLKGRFTLLADSPCPRWGAWGEADAENPSPAEKGADR